MQLLADAGSSKTTWIAFSGDVRQKEFTTSGINPYVSSSDEIRKVISEMRLNYLKGIEITQVFFYGAGCTELETKEKIKVQFVNEGFDHESLFVGTDLLAAGRALFGKDNGICCILGTGSSTGLVKAGEITDEIPALGYVLGDEGGGVDLGRRLLVAYLKRDLDQEMKKEFEHKYNLNKSDILAKIYFEPAPNKFLASFAPFVAEHLSNPEIQNLARTAFSNFIKVNVLKYDGFKDLQVGFVGSVAVAFQKIITELILEFGLKKGPFLGSPISGLIEFHNKFLP